MSEFTHKSSQIGSGPGKFSRIYPFRLFSFTSDQFVVVGSSLPRHGHTEIYNLMKDSWTEVDYYRFHKNSVNAPILYHKSDFYHFGGSNGTYLFEKQFLSIITRLHQGQWSEVGHLKTPRAGHGVIYNGMYFMVVGGMTENYSAR